MYRHLNTSQVSSGSAKRISSNNPFRSALLQDEQRSRSRQNLGSPQEDDEYNNWLDKRVQEQGQDDEYSSDGSFEAGDELDFAPPRPQQFQRTHSGSSTSSRGNSNNPFSKQDYRDEQAAPPPAYHDVVPKSTHSDYPRDEKSSPVRTTVTEVEESENPFPESSRRAPPPIPGSGRTNRSGSGSNRLNVENITNTTTTKIYSDGRVRSKSTGDPMASSLESKQRSQRKSGERHHQHQERSERSDRSDRPHRSHSHSQGGHRSSRRNKRFVQAKSRNVDTIDRLDVTGFFGGAKFHHDGPFDACTPQRNKDVKAAPVAAFPADGPNNSIKGVQPNLTKDDQYDMMFGVNNIDTKDKQNILPYKEIPKAQQQQQQQQQQKQFAEREDSVDTVDTVAGALGKAHISQLDVTNTKKLVGEESLGLGSTTFVDGAPVYGAAAATNSEKENNSGLGRKKTLLGRMKTIVRK